MFLSEDPKKIEFVFGKKRYTISVTEKDQDLDLNNLYEKILDLSKNRGEECKNIQSLGYGLCGSTMGFMMGWLVRAIKGNSDWKINYKEEALSDDEFKTYMISMCNKGSEYFDELKKKFENGEADITLKSLPVVGDSDGTNLF